MTLTQNDLLAIGDLIDQKLEQKLEEKLEQKLEKKLEQKLEEKFEQKLEPIRNEIVKIQKGQHRMQKTLDETIRYFDREVSHNSRCIDHLYAKTGITPLPKAS